MAFLEYIKTPEGFLSLSGVVLSLVTILTRIFVGFKSDK